jgi:hypothetical protein
MLAALRGNDVGEPTVEQPGGQPLADLDEDALTPVVRSVLESHSASITEWSVAPLASVDVHFGAGRLFLVTGTAAVGLASRSWSVVLKPIAREDAERAMEPSDASDDYAFWKREPLAYASGVLERLPKGGLRAPRCYGVVERGPDHYWIWLEHLVRDDAWPLARYEVAARHLGAFNGANIAGESPPQAAWTASTSSVQAYWGAAHPALAPAVEFLETPAMWRHDELRRAVDPLRLGDLAAFFAEQDAFVAALAALPQTFCHNDALRTNLFADDRRSDAHQTIAVDWQVAGLGPIGSELAMLIAGSVLFLKVRAEAIDDLADRIWTAYVAGLKEAGYRPDEVAARFAYAASIAARCGLLAAIWLRNGLEDPDWVAGVWGRPASDVMAQHALLAAFLDRRAAEARQLIGRL